MFKKILAATDMVKVADAAVLTAANLAEAYQAELYILHVLESASSENRHQIKHFETDAEIMLNDAYAQQVKNTLKNSYVAVLPPTIDYQIRITTGFPWAEILGWSREIESDLIVLGPHSGRAEEKGVVRVAGKVGSTVEGVVTQENCPVMIVNRLIPKEKLAFKKVVVGIDFSASCAYAIRFAVNLAHKFGSALFLFHMIPVPPYPKYTRENYEADLDSSRQRLIAFCRDHVAATDHEYHLWGGSLPHLELLKCAEKTGADAIVLGSHTKEAEGKWYAGSAVERAGFRANCPVIVINDPEALQEWKGLLTPKTETEGRADHLIHVFSKKYPG
ncbi:MAG: universal stress protein [Proteobacteria bacterium]|nr:universal stress protein [Pseudomonadota bacterium]